MLGIDPDPERLWPAAAHLRESARDRQTTAAAVAEHCRLLIDAAGESCVAIKPQLACFERLGSDGWSALEATAQAARDAGLLVIADGKRGDVPVTAKAYSEALFADYGCDSEALIADATTVNPLLGEDSIEPFVETAKAHQAGIFLLVRTSNPGAAGVQDLELADGRPVWQRFAEIVAKFGGQPGGNSGIADIGAVVGATVPDHLVQARKLMPYAPLLLPGVGAQGGRVEDLAPAFTPGPAGGLVAVSRSIANAYEQSGEDPAVAARDEAARLREVAWSVATAA